MEFSLNWLNPTDILKSLPSSFAIFPIIIAFLQILFSFIQQVLLNIYQMPGTILGA